MKNASKQLVVSALQQLPVGSSQEVAEAAVLFVCDRVENRQFTFVPTNNGPQSHELNRLRNKLVEESILVWDEEVSIKNVNFELKSHLDPSSRSAIEMLVKRFDKLGVDGFLSYMRSTYQTIYEDVAKTTSQNKRNKKTGELSTLGYEGKTVDEFLAILIKNQVNLLVDVRANAISRKFGFSKTRMRDVCNQSEIEYIHLSELGIDTTSRNLAKQSGDWSALFKTYQKSLKSKISEVERIAKFVNEGRQACLVCFEHAACDCHRSYLAKHIEKKYQISHQNL